MSKKSEKSRNSQISFQKNFYSDITMDKLLYAAVVRSPVSEGIVKSITHPDLPEEYTLVTSRDIPGTNLIDTPHGKIPIFCEGNISYEGQPLALLTGPDETELKQILQELVITIDTNSIEDYLPTEDDITAENFENPNRKLTKKILKQQNEEIENIREIRKEFFSDTIATRNLSWGKCFEKKEDEKEAPGIESVFKESDYIIENTWTYALKTPEYSEPTGAVCSWKQNELTVIAPTLWINGLRHMLSQVLSIDEDSINIKKTLTTNRGTNTIWFNSIISCQVAAASLKTGHPVKLVYTREEQEKFLDTIQPISIKHETAVKADGTITAMKVNINVDAGFANPLAQEILDRLVIASCGIYNPQNILIEAKANYSSRPSSSVDYKQIDSAAFFAVENQINEIAKACNLTPLEIRLKNIAETDSKKSKSKFKKLFNFDLEKVSETLQAAAKMSDYNRKYASFHLDSKNWEFDYNPKEYVSVFSPPMRGIGFACGFQGSEYAASILNGTKQTLEVTLESEDTIVIHTPPVSPSIYDIWKKTASGILEKPNINVKINSAFKAGEEPPLPENVSSNINIMTELLKKCCASIKKRKASDKLPYSVKKKLFSTKNEWNSEDFTGKPFYAASFGAAVIELELNSCTYCEEIKSIHFIINGGKILNKQAAIASVRLQIQKILNALTENESRNCKNIKISFIQSDRTPASMGEIIYQILPAAFTQALSQAMNCVLNSLPLETDTLFNTLDRHKKLIKRIKTEQLQKEENKNENSTNTEQQ